MSAYRPGDASVRVNGEAVTMRLTLGALAELEDRLGGGDFSELTRRLEKTGVGNLLILLEALSAGGGRRLSVHELETAEVDLAEAAGAVAKAFAVLAPQGRDPRPKVEDRLSASPQGGGEDRGAPYLPLAGRSKSRSDFGWGEDPAGGDLP